MYPVHALRLCILASSTVHLTALQVFTKTPGQVWVRPGQNATFQWEVGNHYTFQDNIVRINVSGQHGEASQMTWGDTQSPSKNTDNRRTYSNFSRTPTSVSFTMLNVSLEDMGTVIEIQYYDQGSYKSNENTTIIIDQAPSNLKIEQDPELVSEGDRVSLRCSATSNIPEKFTSQLIYTWLREGTAISSNDSGHEIRFNGTQLDIKSAAPGKTQYSCLVKEARSTIQSQWKNIVIQVMFGNTSDLTTLVSSQKESSHPKEPVEATKVSPYRGSTEETGTTITPGTGGTNEKQSDKIREATYEVPIIAAIGALAAVVLIIMVPVCICRNKKKRSKKVKKMQNAEALPNPNSQGTLRSTSDDGKTPTTEEPLNIYSYPDEVYDTIDDSIDSKRGSLPPIPGQADDLESSYIHPRGSTSPGTTDLEGLIYNGSNVNICNEELMVRSASLSTRCSEAALPSMDNAEYLTTKAVDETCVKSTEEKNPNCQNQYFRPLQKNKSNTYLQILRE